MAKTQGAKRQAVCLNAGAALYIAGKADTIEARRPHGRKTDRQWRGSKRNWKNSLQKV